MNIAQGGHGIERRLAAIVIADIVGYTRHMSRDEAGVLERLTTQRREIIGPLIDAANGRIVKLMGDGLLVEFPSVVSAVDCALLWQKETAAHDAGLPRDERLQYRIGINLGDIIRQDGDIFGDGVNIAQRLEAMAEPAGICISDDAWRHAVGKTGAQTQSLGEQQLKNMPRPIHVLRIITGVTSAAPAKIPSAGRPALAVLPFRNISGDADQEYFSDGLTEDIITSLSYLRSLPVIARNSSFAFKGRDLTPQQIASELGVRYLVEGSVRKAGARVRITAQLTDADSGRQVWTERYDREMADVFDLQDEISRNIATKVVPQMELVERQRSRAKRTEDLDAWDYYLRGIEGFNLNTVPGQKTAIEMFRAAVERDPGYTDAWARLGWSLARLRGFGGAKGRRKEVLDEAGEAARTALALDESSAVAHMAMGSVHVWSGETELGLAEAEIALDLNPNFAHAALAVGNRLDLVGRTAEGIDRLEHALRLNPRDSNLWRYLAYLARAYVTSGEYTVGADYARRALKLRPDLPEALFRCAVCIAHAGEDDEARELVKRCHALDPDYLGTRASWRPYPDDERNEHLLSAIRKLELLPDA